MNHDQTAATAWLCATHLASGQLTPTQLAPTHWAPTPRQPLNSCHRCGATAYKTLIARDGAGAMRPSGQYQCVQCKWVFKDVKAWRDGPCTAEGQAGEAGSAGALPQRWTS